MTESARVYDLDGTLVRLAVDWRAAERALRDAIRATSVDVDADGASVWELFDVAEANGILDAVEGAVAPHEIEGARNAERLPTADELADCSVPVAVCSLNCEEACRIALERHDLLDEVAAIVGRDTVPFRKPRPEPLLAAIRALDGEPDETLFVGDSVSDERTAERAGTAFRYVDGVPRND